MTAPDSLETFLRHARSQVDEALERYLPHPPACPPILSEAMRYSVFAGGKRFRPALTLAAADAVTRCGHRGSDGNELPAACAIELIHTYSLIHDDLPAMDNDTLRRGRPTLHMIYGDGLAILAGDGLQAEAFALLAREPVSDDPTVVLRKLRVLDVIAGAAATSGLVGGQAIDLQAAGQGPQPAPALDAEGLRRMHSAKTGALIRAAATSGAIMAGGSVEIARAVDRYALDLGIAFQIVDDILDVEGTAQQLGKTAGKDASAAKPTYPALFGVERSRALAFESVSRARQALDEVRLGGWLIAIADWVVSRKA